MLGYLYTGIDRGKAVSHFETTRRLAKTDPDKSVIGKYLDELKA